MSDTTQLEPFTQTWEHVFRAAITPQQLQDAIEMALTTDGPEKTARFLAKSLAPTPMGQVLNYLVDEVDRLRARFEGSPASMYPPRVAAVLSTVALVFGVDIVNIVGPSRLPNFVEARYTVMHVLRDRYQMGLVEIGGHLNRDHSTVIHGVEQMALKLASDSAFCFETRDRYKKVVLGLTVYDAH